MMAVFCSLGGSTSFLAHWHQSLGLCSGVAGVCYLQLNTCYVQKMTFASPMNKVELLLIVSQWMPYL